MGQVISAGPLSEVPKGFSLISEFSSEVGEVFSSNFKFSDFWEIFQSHHSIHSFDPSISSSDLAYSDNERCCTRMKWSEPVNLAAFAFCTEPRTVFAVKITESLGQRNVLSIGVAKDSSIITFPISGSLGFGKQANSW